MSIVKVYSVNSCSDTREMLKNAYASSFEKNVPVGWILKSTGIVNLRRNTRTTQPFVSESDTMAIQCVSHLHFELCRDSLSGSDLKFLVEDDD